MTAYKLTSYYGNSKTSSSKAQMVYFTNGATRVTVYFSYETIIAIRSEDGLVISENHWGTTTGKHLNAIATDKNIRVPHSEVMNEVERVLGTTSISITDYCGLSAMKVTTNNGIFFFSYETLVGVLSRKSYNCFIAKNIWSRTTGKHIHAIGFGVKEIVEPDQLITKFEIEAA